ncbi:SH3 domain-containing protein [Laspinema sp. A4]|uniref:SH3 domain-containing protein n=1 Tax=Laspinema sp. D2d TaxID=2953686 RepID=UPI0021BA6DA3|nr:SH3 domain-containing protein [Laspinema sp. D2d]MCT7982284.1 SH3 domain-containing protein [Laspinema sp. D2d]
MKLLNLWTIPIALLSVMTIALPQAIATPLAQAEAPDLCRRVMERRGLAVHRTPDPSQTQIGGVDPNATVTLAADAEPIVGSDGRIWIKITAPVEGFISNGPPNSGGNLAYCSGSAGPRPSATPPTSTTPSPVAETPEIPNGQFCRQVNGLVTPQGLAIRSAVSGPSQYLGGVPANGRVQLIEDYEYIPDPGGIQRSWVEIVAPIKGFVSVNSLIRCF